MFVACVAPTWSAITQLSFNVFPAYSKSNIVPVLAAALQVALLAACQQRGIKVLCVAGAGAKADPTRLRIVDVSESSVDPLARAVRQK
jgi:tRNA A37 threonylcarbamoyladenosine dehydratase